MRGLFEGWHLIILLVLILLLFGAKRLPDAARGLGRSMRIFKAEMKDMTDDDDRPAPRDDRPRPVEGRVVDDPVRPAEPRPATEQAREAERRDV
jgi:sec-independent protein translocase protein TatA